MMDLISDHQVKSYIVGEYRVLLFTYSTPNKPRRMVHIKNPSGLVTVKMVNVDEKVEKIYGS